MDKLYAKMKQSCLDIKKIYNDKTKRFEPFDYFPLPITKQTSTTTSKVCDEYLNTLDNNLTSSFYLRGRINLIEEKEIRVLLDTGAYAKIHFTTLV